MIIDLYVSTNKVGSRCHDEVEIDDQDWEDMNEREREDFMLEALWDSGMIDWNYQERE